MAVPTKLNKLLPYDSAVFGIYLKELKTCPHKNPHTDVVEVLVIIAQT